MAHRALLLAALTLPLAMSGCFDDGPPTAPSEPADDADPASDRSPGAVAARAPPPEDIRLVDSGLSYAAFHDEWEWYVESPPQAFSLRFKLDSGQDDAFAGTFDYELRADDIVLLEADESHDSNGGASSTIAGTRVVVQPGKPINVVEYDAAGTERTGWYTFEVDAWTESEAGTSPVGPYRYDLEVVVDY